LKKLNLEKEIFEEIQLLSGCVGTISKSLNILILLVIFSLDSFNRQFIIKYSRKPILIYDEKFTIDNSL